MRVISLGAGVQSSTLFLMSCLGQLEKADCAIFADTQQEPSAVYTYLSWLEHQGREHGIPVYRVTGGDLGADALARKDGEKGRYANIPFYLKWPDGGSGGMMRRQCTGDYKLDPIKRKIRELLKERDEKVAEMWIGISVDELQRMRDSGVKYIENHYPLVDRRMSRHDCLAWYDSHGFPAPPRSACVFCPYRKDAEWARLKREDPKGFQAAVEFDEQIRQMPGIRGTCYVHRSMKPLKDVDFDNPEDNGQLDFGFAGECEGMCGL